VVCGADKKRKQKMKKLMVLAAVAVAAFASNAASIKWESGTISLPDGSAASSANKPVAYLFLLNATEYASYSSYTDGAALSNAIWADYGTQLASADATKTATNKGVANLTDPTTYSNGDTAYAAIIYTDTQDGKDYWMGNVATITLDSDLDRSVSDLSLKIGGTGNATAWATASVPEPTSGLLMLLGMAGLALRRRRA
jgi:hypothetical protein